MKRRSIERVERRRALAELNLAGENRPRRNIPRKGCLSFLMPVLLGLGALAALAEGLH